MSEGNKKCRRTSHIWQYFKALGKDDQAVCNTCNGIFSFRSTTSNLKKHLRQKHNHDFKSLTERAVENLEQIANNVADIEEVVSYEFVDHISGEQVVCENGISEEVIIGTGDGQPSITTMTDLEKYESSKIPMPNDSMVTEENITEISKPELDQSVSTSGTTPQKPTTPFPNIIRKQYPVKQQKANSPNIVKLPSLFTRNKPITSINEAHPSHDMENEFQLFGKHVALQLQKLSLLNAALAQEEIQSVLTRYRIYELTGCKQIQGRSVALQIKPAVQ